MDKKELENLLMRFSHLGVTHSKNGALLIGKAPHIAEYAWLNIMYPCITEAEVCDLEKKLGVAIPDVYRDFLMNVSNGLNIMNCTLALHGCRTSYNRADFESRYPHLILKMCRSLNGLKMPHRKCSFLPLIIMTAQSSILIPRMIRYTIATAMMRRRLNHGIRYRQC